MIETEVFQELNLFGPNGAPTPDLIGDAPPENNKTETKCCGLVKSRSRTTVGNTVLFFKQLDYIRLSFQVCWFYNELYFVVQKHFIKQICLKTSLNNAA